MSKKTLKKHHNSNKDIQHHHMLIRMETELHPSKNDMNCIKNIIKQIINDLNMELLGGPYIYYQDMPFSHKGITSITSIKTSHISFHFWDTPELNILQNANSKSLLQFDIYTCGTLTKNQALKIIKYFNIYNPTRLDIDIINRKKKLKIDHHLHWNYNNKTSFDEWIENKLVK